VKAGWGPSVRPGPEATIRSRYRPADPSTQGGLPPMGKEQKMLKSIKRFFGGPSTATRRHTGTVDPEHDLRVATCALLLEMGRIDDSFTDAEMETILTVLKQKYGLSTAHAEALMAAADQELESSIDYWQFARLINENYSTEEKIGIIEMLWTIVFVDGRMDRHEHYLMNKLATLLRLTHEQLIEAKLKITRAQ
jgi:uncharacterized tellurite resistance protein B-like protein